MHEKEQKPKQSTDMYKNAQESKFCFLQSACWFPDFTLFFWTFDFQKNPWQSFDININIIYNILYVSESYKQRTFGKKKDREVEALGSLEEYGMAMDAEVHLTFIIRNGKYPAITWEQVTTQLTEGGVG